MKIFFVAINPNDIVRWDELKVADRLEEYRANQTLFKGTSFETISAYGANGAIIHYKVVG